ncbi:DMT family transporter [Benzoatithermus flavus]|uniref:DMT family transporter n=1 Tax=Benzoatithermus flavus TaxID=3108223 RepID=UPI003AAACE36
MVAAAPWLFLTFWSSGFVAAKIGLRGAEPLTFLALRFALVTLVMAGIAGLRRSPWPRTRAELVPVVVTGLLMQAVYFGCTYLAFAAGVGAGALALIVGLQPLLTAVVAGPFLGERVRPIQWLGLVLGLVGVALVLEDKLALGASTATGVIWSFLGLFAITGGTLYQKRFAGAFDLWSGGAVQFAVATLVVAPVAAASETMRIAWSWPFASALAYLVLMNSIVAITLLTIMIRRGEASRVTSLFFLVPPGAAFVAWLVLAERLSLVQLAGMAVATGGVGLVMRRASTVK